MINQYPPFDFIYTQVNWVIAKQEMEVFYLSFFGLLSLMMGFMLCWIRWTEEREIRRRREGIRWVDMALEDDSDDEEEDLTSPMSTEAIMVWLFTADQLFYPQLKGATLMVTASPSSVPSAWRTSLQTKRFFSVLSRSKFLLKCPTALSPFS